MHVCMYISDIHLNGAYEQKAVNVPAKLTLTLNPKSRTQLYLNGACGQRAVNIPAKLSEKGVVKDCYQGQI